MLNTVLVYSEEQGIDLTDQHKELSDAIYESTETSAIILTVQHKDTFLSRLGEANFSLEALRDYYNEFNECSEAGAGQPMVDAIGCLRQSLEALDADSVIVLGIG